MKTYPLQSLTLIEAQQKQFALVDTICRHFPGSEFLTRGDLGLTPGLNQPRITQRVEQVLADAFTHRLRRWYRVRVLERFVRRWRLCSNRGSVFWCMTRLFTRRLRSLLRRWG